MGNPLHEPTRTAGQPGHSSNRADDPLESSPGSGGFADSIDPDLLDRALHAFRTGDRRRHGAEALPGADLFECLHEVEGVRSLAPLPSIPGFHVLRLLGQGGMGTVYEAEEPQLRRRVAIKVVRADLALDESRLILFQREVQILARLRHPGIAAIHGVGRTADGLPCCIMELVEGHRLLDHVSGARSRHTPAPIELRARLRLFVSICDAVAFAHRRGVVHRDLKPANIMVVDRDRTESGTGSLSPGTARRPTDDPCQPKVLDFGLAKLVDVDGNAGASTHSVAGLVGTIQYMSPEQIAGDSAAVDIRSDVYALGVILYELLSGSPPHGRRGEPAFATMQAIREAKPAPLRGGVPGVDRDLEAVVFKAIEKEPAGRYQSVAEFADDVRRLLDGRPVLARSASRWCVRRRLLKRHWRMAAALGAAFIACAAVAAVTTRLWLASDRSLQRVIATNGALRDVLQAADPEQLGKDVTVRQMLDRVIASADTGEFSQDRLTEAFIRANAGACLFSLGDVLAAESQLALARSLYQREGDVSSPEYAECIADLAVAGRYNGRPGAIDLIEEAIRLREAHFGRDDPRTIALVHDLGYFLRDRKEFGLAEAAFQRAIAARRVSPGPSSEELAVSLNSLGQLYKQMERWEDSERAITAARQIYAVLPPSIVSAHNLNELATAARRGGRLDEAISLDVEALAIFREKLQPNDEVLKRASVALARELGKSGRHAEAAEIWQSLLDGWREFPPFYAADRPAIALALGRELLAMDRFGEAETFCIAAFEESGRLELADREKSAAEALALLHDRWESSAPGEGHAEEADRWRARAAATSPAPPR